MGGIEGLVPKHAIDGEILDGGELLLVISVRRKGRGEEF